MKLNMLNTFEIYNKILKENLILEDVQGNNNKSARNFIRQNYPEFIDRKITLPNGETKIMSASDWINQIRHDIPSVRLPIIKNNEQSHNFILGVTRLYFSFTESNPTEIQGKISNLENIMQLIVNKYIDKFDKNLNDISDPKNPKELSYEDLNQRFANEIKQNANNEDAEIDELAAQDKFIKDDSYTIVQIPDFKTAQDYAQYTEWCITKQDNMYDRYTKNGIGIFYFCLKKGYEKLKKPDKSFSTDSLDEYGRSMIAISVNDDGSLNSCTSRWNNGDRVLENKLEISKFFGVVFNNIFKPRDFNEILNKYKKDAIPSEIAKKHNAIETTNELIIVAKDKKIIKYKKCYNKDNIKCFVYDKFYWFDVKTGEEIDPPNEINGNFNCTDHTQLISLKGAPKIINGNFYCSDCDSLTSLKGGPIEVGGYFYCSDCPSLTSLEGAPRKVNGTFACIKCDSLISLKGAPKTVNGSFDCSRCKSLTSLADAPEIVDGYFKCSHLKSLTSLKGAPRKVGKDFDCSECDSLTSLEGCPIEVGGDFNCYSCTSLISLEGAPRKVKNFSCSRCTSLTSLEGGPTEVIKIFYCLYCSQLSSLKGAPRIIKGTINFTGCTKLKLSMINEYKKWLKTNPTENYLVNTSIEESYVKYILSNFAQLC